MPATNTSAVSRERGTAVTVELTSLRGALDHDDGAVVLEIAARELAAADDDLLGDLGRRKHAQLGQAGVEPFVPPELAARAPRLDDAVRVQDDERPRLQPFADLLVALLVVDAEREAAGLERLDAAVRPDEPWMRMARGGAHALAAGGIERQIDERDELLGRELLAGDVGGEGEEG